MVCTMYIYIDPVSNSIYIKSGVSYRRMAIASDSILFLKKSVRNYTYLHTSV